MRFIRRKWLCDYLLADSSPKTSEVINIDYHNQEQDVWSEIMALNIIMSYQF